MLKSCAATIRPPAKNVAVDVPFTDGKALVLPTPLRL
jgi:hypothetical protein